MQPRAAESVRQARVRLMGGRGPGASPSEVAAHTRNRVVIAGVSTTRRLELAARQTRRARCDPGGIVDAIELERVELAVAARRLAALATPVALLGVAGRRIMTACGQHPGLLGGALLLAVACRRRRASARAGAREAGGAQHRVS